MTICLNRQAILKNETTLDEILLLLTIHHEIDVEKAKDTLIDKGFITAKRDESLQPIGWQLTNEGVAILNSVILDSDKNPEPPDRLTYLATKLKEIFPKGKKSGTNYYWSDGIALIIRRLKIFFKKYGNEYTDEQIIQAAEKYVQGFNGDYQYMRLLKYFIFREKTGAGGDVEGDSELISYIENSGQEDELNNNWTSTLK